MKRPVQIVAAALVALGIASGASADIRTDIVFVVDETGSMGTEQVNLRNNIGTFASILSAGASMPPTPSSGSATTPRSRA